MPTTLLSCAVFALALSATVAAADSTNGASFPVQAAILLENGEPVAGAATCTVGEACRIFAKEQQKIDLSLKVSRSSLGCPFKELTLRCEDGDCSFHNGRSFLKFDSERRFDFFEGRDAVETQLVLRARVKIGRIFLIVPNFDRDCRAIESPIKG